MVPGSVAAAYAVTRKCSWQSAVSPLVAAAKLQHCVGTGAVLGRLSREAPTTAPVVLHHQLERKDTSQYDLRSRQLWHLQL